MKNKFSGKSDKLNENKIIEKALKTGGFLFPETVEEVLEFERLFGTTEVILPPELDEPKFLNSKFTNGNVIVMKTPCNNFAMAAREASSKLPKEIEDKIIQDIKKAQLKDGRKRK